MNFSRVKAQINYIDNDGGEEGSIISRSNTNSSYDCFSKCIGNINCKHVTRLYPSFNQNDCILKSKYSNSNKNIPSDSENAKIAG